MGRLALAKDSMNKLHCPEHPLVYTEEKIARIQGTLKIKNGRDLHIAHNDLAETCLKAIYK
jgi:hypothetical protein